MWKTNWDWEDFSETKNGTTWNICDLLVDQSNVLFFSLIYARLSSFLFIINLCFI